MKKPVCYIIGAGEHLTPLPQKNSKDMVIAADGGYSFLSSLGRAADIIIGDFDSLGFVPCGNNVVVLSPIKDNTDMEAAIEEGWNCGYRFFAIYGGLGGRIDHTIANIQCIASIAARGGRGFLIGKDSIITAIHNDKICFSPESSGYISVFSHDEKAYGVYESGLKYSLNDSTLSNKASLGVSNEFTGIESCISVRDGTLIIVYPIGTEEIYK